MYSTVKEMHLAIDLGLQQINSNRKQSILPEWKDMALNYAVLQFIETRTNPKTNIKREGLEDTQKRYDDLRDLKRSFVSPIYLHNNSLFSILPPDYLKYISFGVKVKYDKFNKINTIGSKDIHARILKFPDDTNNPAYNKFRIVRKDSDNNNTTLFHIDDYANISNLYGRESKFVIINLVLQELNLLDGYEVYWERWSTYYYKDSFIIITTKNNNHYINYGDKKDDSWVSSDTYKLFRYNIFKQEGKYSPANPVSSIHEFSNNFYNNRNKHLNPDLFLSDGNIYLKEGDNYVATELSMIYYKKPRLINIHTNTNCEIQVNREIVDLAIQRLKAYIKDEGYQHIVNENQIIE